MGAGSFEQHEIRVVSTYTDQLTAPLSASQRAIDAYVASLQRMVDLQGRAGMGGSLTAGGRTVASASPAAARASYAGPGAVAPPASYASAPAGGVPHPAAASAVAPVAAAVGGAPPPGAARVGAFAPPAAGGGGGGGPRGGGYGGGSGGGWPRGTGSWAAAAPPGGGGPGRGGGGRPPPGGAGGPGALPPPGNQTTRLRYVVEGLRDVEAVSGALTGVVQSVMSLRSLMAGGGAAAALVGVPMGMADQATRAQRAFSQLVGTVQQGSQMAQQMQGQLTNQPFDLSTMMGAGVNLARVSGGRFAAQAGPELAAATNAATSLGGGADMAQQIASIMASAQSMSTRRRMSGAMVNQLEDLGIPDVYGGIAAARNQAHPGEQWTRQSLQAYLMSGGTLPGVESSRELMQYLNQQYPAATETAQTNPDVARGILMQRATNATMGYGAHVNAALNPAMQAALQGNYAQAAFNLNPISMMMADPLGAAGVMVGGGIALGGAIGIATRSPFRAVRPIGRLASALGMPLAGRLGGAMGRGGGGGNLVTMAARNAATNPRAASRYAAVVRDMVSRGADVERAHAVAGDAVATEFGSHVAAQIEYSGVPQQAERGALASEYTRLSRNAAGTSTAGAQNVAVEGTMAQRFGPDWRTRMAATPQPPAAGGPSLLDRFTSRFRRGGGGGGAAPPPPGAGGPGGMPAGGPGRSPGGGGVPGGGAGAAAAERDVGVVASEAGAVGREAGVLGGLGRVAGVAGRVGGAVGRVAPWLGLGLGLFGAYSELSGGQQASAARDTGGAVGGAAGGWAGAEAGAAGGAALGTLVFPGVGTAVGGLAGGLIGGLGGGLAGDWLGSHVGGALAGAMGWQDTQTQNEAVRQQQRGTDVNRDLYQETNHLADAFTDLDKIVRQVTSTYQNIALAGGGAGGNAIVAPPGGGAAGAPFSFGGPATGPNGPIQPGNSAAPPKPGDVAGWKQWLQPFIPPELAGNPGFLNTLVAGASAESGLDPNKDQAGGGGRGLFQFDIGGMGKGLTPAQLHDPAFQAQRIVPLYAQAWKNAPAGMSDADKASWVAAQAERPYDYTNPNSTARVNYASAYQKVAGVTPDVSTMDLNSPAVAPVSPDISAGDAGGNTMVQTGDINIPTTVGGVPQDRAGQRQWARDVSGVLMEAIAGGVSTSSSGTAVATSGAPLAFGG